jgi:hypothetical protein
MVAALLVRTAHAELPLPGATLAVTNPPSLAGCIDETQLGARILAQLSHGADNAPAVPPLSLEVTLQQTSSGLVAELRMSGRAGGSRRIEAERCEGLKEALAVTIAMILDHDAEESQTAPVAGAVAAIPAQPSAPAPADGSHVPNGAAPAVPATPSSGKKLAKKPANPPTIVRIVQESGGNAGPQPSSAHELRAWAGGGYGTSKSGLLEVGAEYAFRDWALRMGAFYQPKRDISLGVGHLELFAMGGIAEGCHRFGGNWRIVPCAVMMLGAERVEGFGFDQGASRQLLVGSTGPALGFETGSRWVMGLELVGLAGWWQDQYSVNNPQKSVKSPLLAAWLVARVALSSRGEPAASP